MLVLGAGPIGLLAMQIARSMGCTRTMIADMNPSRLELALKMGADVCIGEYSINLKDKGYYSANNKLLPFILSVFFFFSTPFINIGTQKRRIQE